MVEAFPSPLSKDNNNNNPSFKGSFDNNIKPAMCHLPHAAGQIKRSLRYGNPKNDAEPLLFLVICRHIRNQVAPFATCAGSFSPVLKWHPRKSLFQSIAEQSET